MDLTGDAEDIAEFEGMGGLSFVFGVEDEDKRSNQIDYLLARGVSVTRPNANDGLTPLHSAVLPVVFMQGHPRYNENS